MKAKIERRKKLSCQEVDLKEFIRRILLVDPKPLWKEEKVKRRAKKGSEKEDR